MTINTDKISEGIHYELIPGNEDNDQSWDIRIKEGNFVESVIRFGNIGFDPDLDALTFNFVLVSTPDEDLTEDNSDLQDFVGGILEDVLEKAAADGSLISEERDD